MTTITISDPITWWERCKWLQAHDKNYVDATCWAAWQIGMDDIYISVDSEVATLYYLTWPQI
jgi:hypothetical protein